MNVEYYVRSNGECPAKEFINSLPLKCQAKAFRSIMLLEEYGYELRMPFSRFIYDGIYELRSVVSSAREIIKAKLYKADYLSKHSGGNSV